MYVKVLCRLCFSGLDVSCGDCIAAWACTVDGPGADSNSECADAKSDSDVTTEQVS